MLRVYFAYEMATCDVIWPMDCNLLPMSGFSKEAKDKYSLLTTKIEA